MKVDHLHMYDGNIQQNSLCVESCVTEEFHISPRFSLHLRVSAAVVAELAVYAVDEHHAGAVLLFSTPLYSSRLYAQKTLGSKLFKRASRSVQRECPAEPFMRSILFY